jgi:O-Antigen ligase
VNAGTAKVRGAMQRPGELPSSPSADPATGRSQLLEWFADTPELLPGVLAVAVFVFWATAQGGVAATDSYPGALILLGVLVGTGFAYRAELFVLPRLVLAAFALLLAFTAWNFLSIGWADDQGAAWDGANRCLTYLIVFGLFALPPWRPRAAALLVGIYTVAITVVGLVVLLKAAGAADPLRYFVAGRFSEPTGYQNAQAALFTMSMFPAVFLAARRETPWPLRGVMLSCAGILFAIALLPQSRGWLIAAPIAVIAYLVIVPGLVRSLTVILPLAVVMAVISSPVLHVFDVSDDPSRLGPALTDAKTAILIAAAVLLVIGCAIGYADRKIELPERVETIGSRVVLIGAGVVALAGVVVALAVIGNPVSWANDRWQDFKGGKFEYQTGGGTRLGGGLGSNRYDFWRVAADEFKNAPLIGVGSDNFAEDYVRDRHSDEEPTYPHNLGLQVLSETGLIGGLLFLGFLVISLTGMARVRLRSEVPISRGVAAVLAVVFVYWFVHSIGDWFWAFPALSAPIFAWLGIGMRLDAERATLAPPRWAKGWIAPVTAGSAAALLFAIASMGLPWMAAIDVNKAAASWGANPHEAFNRLDEARKLNFLSARPDLVQGAIAAQLGEDRRVRSSFERALERDPRSWYAEIELATLDGVEGNKQSALARLDRVAALNPREPLTATVRQGVLSGKPVTLDELDADFLYRYCNRLGRKPGPNGCQTG